MATQAERSAASEARFRGRVSAHGATLLEPIWLGADSPHRVQCKAGHLCTPTPTNVRRGGEICRTCAHRDPAATEAAFRAYLRTVGAAALWDRWAGGQQPHHVRCAAGHDCYPRWVNTQRGIGICRACAGQDPAVTETAFRAAVARLGGTVLGRYVNARKGVHCRCSAGHNCRPTPDNVLRGQGICLTCKNRTWDVLYVVENPQLRRVKFGITGGTGATRLSRHRRYGYTVRHLLAPQLPENTARSAENAIRHALRDAGESPQAGTEYFDSSCLAVILDVATSWLTPDDEKLDRLDDIIAGWGAEE